jgi:nicotinate phosphoribosyltransferase
MPLPINQWGLYTDFYELTMAQGYYLCERKMIPVHLTTFSG